jgi:hypothetical protein
MKKKARVKEKRKKGQANLNPIEYQPGNGKFLQGINKKYKKIFYRYCNVSSFPLKCSHER